MNPYVFPIDDEKGVHDMCAALRANRSLAEQLPLTLAEGVRTKNRTLDQVVTDVVEKIKASGCERCGILLDLQLELKGGVTEGDRREAQHYFGLGGYSPELASAWEGIVVAHKVATHGGVLDEDGVLGELVFLSHTRGVRLPPATPSDPRIRFAAFARDALATYKFDDVIGHLTEYTYDQLRAQSKSLDRDHCARAKTTLSLLDFFGTDDPGLGWQFEQFSWHPDSKVDAALRHYAGKLATRWTHEGIDRHGRNWVADFWPRHPLTSEEIKGLFMYSPVLDRDSRSYPILGSHLKEVAHQFLGLDLDVEGGDDEEYALPGQPASQRRAFFPGLTFLIALKVLAAKLKDEGILDGVSITKDERTVRGNCVVTHRAFIRLDPAASGRAFAQRFSRKVRSQNVDGLCGDLLNACRCRVDLTGAPPAVFKAVFETGLDWAVWPSFGDDFIELQW